MNRKQFLNSEQWKKYETMVITLLGSSCVNCERDYGLSTIWIDPSPFLMLNLDNMLVVCTRCKQEIDNKISDEEDISLEFPLGLIQTEQDQNEQR